MMVNLSVCSQPARSTANIIRVILDSDIGDYGNIISRARLLSKIPEVALWIALRGEKPPAIRLPM